MSSLINKQLLLTAYAYLFIIEQQKVQQGSEATPSKLSDLAKQNLPKMTENLEDCLALAYDRPHETETQMTIKDGPRFCVADVQTDGLDPCARFWNDWGHRYTLTGESSTSGVLWNYKCAQNKGKFLSIITAKVEDISKGHNSYKPGWNTLQKKNVELSTEGAWKRGIIRLDREKGLLSVKASIGQGHSDFTKGTAIVCELTQDPPKLLVK